MSQSIFRNPFVFSPPALTLSSVGNGTLTIDKLTHFTVDQKYTAVCTATAPFTVFNVVGDKDGAVGVAVVGTQFFDEDLKIFLTIQQGPNLYEIGDTFNFEVKRGTDLTQQNIDEYDELPQKNFGPGPVGTNAGDHNLRFNPSSVAASKLIGNLSYQAAALGPDGNDISIEYLAGTLLTPASKTIQAIKYEANAAGVNGNNIQIEYLQFTAAVRAQRNIQDLEYKADVAGANGNNISITYTNTVAVAGNETVSVVGNAITIGIKSGVTTADQIRLAIGLHPTAPTLIDVSATGTGSEPQITQSQTFLTGGLNASGNAGNEVVTVIGNLIRVRLESGVSTAQNILNKILASIPAISLITPSIIGAPSAVQTAPVAATNLEGGTDAVGTPGNEIVEVSSKEIKITFVNGQSTAAQIRNKILATPAAVALISVSLAGTGAELETSPFTKTYLTGGLEGGTYAFNQAELTDPDNFYEGNAPILATDVINQGKDLTFGETLKRGKVTLDDDDLANISGDKVENTQKTINNLIQNGKCFLVSEDDLKTEWSKPAGTLLLNGDITLRFVENGVKNTLLASDGPFNLADGEHLYFIVDRFNNINVTPIIASSVPSAPNGENIFRMVSRVGSTLFWWDNTSQREGKKIRIGEGGSAGAFQEKLGVGNGSQTAFPIPSGLFPIAQESILVFSNTVHFVTDDWTYNVDQNQIEFTVAPAAGVDVYIYFLTDGETITIPAPTGVQQVLYRTIDSTEFANKQLTLPIAPAAPAQVLVDFIGGGAQIFGVDFNISGTTLDWDSLGLDVLIEEGDTLRITYYS